MTPRKARISALFLIVSFIEGIVVAVVLLSIPPDPKNAFLFGYSKGRLALLVVVLLILAFFLFVFINKKIRTRFADLNLSGTTLSRVLFWAGVIVMLLLWLTIWLPAYRFDKQAAGFIRLRPLIIWIELILVQAALTVWALGNHENLRSVPGEVQSSRRWFRTGFWVFVLTVLVFIALLMTNGNFTGNQLYFPPGAPLSALQVVLTWVVFFLLLKLEQRNHKEKSIRKWTTIALFVLMWAVTFVAWAVVPFPCTDDRPGPYPPNNVCYPHVNDAVYSIGSHYITLGQGVYNHWMTDKPLYMAFLALGQAVAGPMIDDYLLFQVGVIALIPAMLYLAGSKKYGHAFGLFLAMLAALQGVYAIMLYREVGSVNVRLENPEVLTALFLVVLSFPLFKWLSHPIESRWAILSGGILGLSVLLRFNPLIIAPFILISILLAGKNRIKRLLPAIMLFGLAFILSFSPWFLTATDEHGRNHYFTKVEEVVRTRFSTQQEASYTGAPADPLSGVDIQNDQGNTPTHEEEGTDGLLNYDMGTIDKAGVSGIAYHFFNNLYSGLAKLPTTLVMHPVSEQVTGTIWTFTKAQPIWKKSLSLENLLVLSLNLVLVLVGVLAAARRFGMAGLTGIIILLGYYTGNAISQTSGGRYLEPVSWVNIFYYSLGIYVLTRWAIQAFTLKKETISPKPVEKTTTSENGEWLRARNWQIVVLLAAFLASGLVLPALNLIPEKLPVENESLVEARAFETLAENGAVDSHQWEKFLNDPKHIILEGRAYHPRYYRGDFYRPGNLSFEIMLLTRDWVAVGYSPRMIPGERFSDGSVVLLIGCKLQQDALWAAKRVIVESIAVIQLNNEGGMLVDDKTDWNCSR